MGIKPKKINIMPFGLSLAFNTNIEEYNKKYKQANLLTIKKLIITIAGPLVNCIIAIIFIIWDIPFFGISGTVAPIGIEGTIREYIIYSNIIIAIINLIPIYPLDGGRIAKYILEIIYGKKVAYNYINIISNVTISLITIASSFAILYLKNIAILVILGYLWYLVLKENKIYKNKKYLYELLER